MDTLEDFQGFCESCGHAIFLSMEEDRKALRRMPRVKEFLRRYHMRLCKCGMPIELGDGN